jgi:hypothetical protein
VEGHHQGGGHQGGVANSEQQAEHLLFAARYWLFAHEGKGWTGRQHRRRLISLHR